MKKVIFHVDVNSAFLSWEACYRLHHLGGKVDLRLIPSAVGGDSESRHGIILAKSILAKEYGIHTGETVADARKKCPDLCLVPPHYDLYHRSSKALMRILEEYSDRVEQYSIDEAFLDMTGCTDWPEKTAERLKDQIKSQLGFTVNVGIGENKLLAKMASDFKKPDRVHTLWHREIRSKLWPLSVRNLFFVGPASENKLKKLGIHTVGELAAADPAMLQNHLKSHGRQIWQYANGCDTSEVISCPSPNKGYGNSLTTPCDISEPYLIKQYLLSLAETISGRLRADEVKIGIVAVNIRDWEFRSYRHQMTLPDQTNLTLEIYKAACECFDAVWDGLPVRHLGIHTSRVSKEDFRQLGLFDPAEADYEKQLRAEQTVDFLRGKFGADCIKRASFLFSPTHPERLSIDHMGGGISRERRTVDYEKEQVI